MKTVLSSLATAALAAVSASAQEGSFDRSLPVSGSVHLDVVTDSGGIQIRSGSGSTVHVHAIIKGNHGWLSSSSDIAERIQRIEQHPPVEQNGNEIRVGYLHDRGLLNNISIRFEIETPVDTTVRAHADSGGVTIAGVSGSVDAKTDSGGIHIEKVKGDVRAAADSGGLHLSEIGGNLYARADSGGIDAQQVGGSIDAQTDSGSVRLSQTHPAQIRAKADSGGISVKLAPNAGYDLIAETDSGRISAPEMTVHSNFSEHHLEGKIGSGGPSVELHASSGSISVE